MPVRAIAPAALGHGLGLVLLAVKSQDTPAALEVLAPRLAADGAIVSLQNGLNEELIARAVGAQRTIGCLVNWAADWIAPGRILHGGHGALVLGELDGRLSDRVQGLAKLLAVVAPTEVTDNVLGYTWAKHVYGALLVATAVVDAHVYEVVERSPEVQQMLVALVVENMRAAEAAGIRLEPFDEYAPADYRAAARGDAAARQRAMTIIGQHYRQHTKTKTGIWRDLAVRRRKTEVGRAARRDGGEGEDARRRHAADRAAHRDDRGSRARPARDELGQRRRAGRGEPERAHDGAVGVSGSAGAGAVGPGLRQDTHGARAHDRRARA